MNGDDIEGLFWEEGTKAPRASRPKPQSEKSEPPPRPWEEPGFLPTLSDRLWTPPLFDRDSLTVAQSEGERLLFDSEIYPNYYLAAFMSVKSGKVIYLEATPEKELDIAMLAWILNNFTTIGFNSYTFDLTIAAIALAGYSLEQINDATQKLISQQIQDWLVLRSYKLKRLKLNHIDLYNVAPLDASLKIYGGRLHVPRMQDLPFKFDTVLTDAQIDVVRDYCIGSDLVNTAYLYKELEPNIELREKMSLQYGTDLCSKSDAQVAETVIGHELTRLNYCKPEKPVIPAGTVYEFKVPDFMKFELPIMQQTLESIRTAKFVVSETGGIETPECIEKLDIKINDKVFKMGIGGLHSQETTVAHIADENTLIVDRDVASYYPNIILKLKLFPQHLGPAFLKVYQSLVDRRLIAKKEGDKITDSALKISINGYFGKTGNKYSIFYAPDLLIQVTMTGQLCLLMLVERAFLAGVQVCSANTDGVLFKCPKNRKADFDALITKWESETGFETEEQLYKGIYSRDVNNYLAVKVDGKCKVKGAYAERGSALNSVLSKNPKNLICSDAVQALLTKGVPVRDTIQACKDIRRFVTVRTVEGGACKDGVYLGKAIRWYYAAGQTGEIIYAKNGNKVPRSDGAKPCLDLPAQFPDDIDLDWYEREANSILVEIGHSKPQVIEKVVIEKAAFVSSLKVLPEPFYKDEYVTVYNGDSAEIAPLLPQFDLLLTDPPYGISITKSNRLATSRGLGGDTWDNEIISQDLINVLCSKAKQAIVWGGNYYPMNATRCFLIWDKQNDGRDFADCEYAWTNLNAVARIFRMRPQKMDGGKLHITQKPLELFTWCLAKALDVQTILDPFAGSGTTGRVAKNAGKRCVLIEKEKHNCEIIAQRMAQEVLF